jgi:hypothetical protein
MNPYVKSVEPQENYCLLLTFENREKRIFDLRPYLDKGVFAQLKDVAWFKTARVVSGSVEWRGEIDLSYDTLYLSSVPVKTIKGKSKASQKAKKELATVPAKRTKQTRQSVGTK